MTPRDLVRVVFLDARSGVELACAELPPERLPPSFVPNVTTVELDGGSWIVEQAERDAQGLTLHVRRETEAGQVLHSLPTVCDALPSLDDSADDEDGTDRHVLHEDEWRQVELVDARLAGAVDRELVGVRRVREAHARRDAGGRVLGFDTVHVRTHPADPLPGRPSWAALRDLLPARVTGPARRVGFFGEPGVVPGSFAVPLGPVVLYGVVDDAGVAVCGVDAERPAGAAAVPELAEAVGRLLRSLGLVLVDWCRAVVVPPAAVRAYLDVALEDPAPDHES